MKPVPSSWMRGSSHNYCRYVFLVGLFCWPGCARETPSDPGITVAEVANPVPEPRRATLPQVELKLVNVARSVGINFTHKSGACGDYAYPEILSGGVCLADLDGDGDLDLYFPQGGNLTGSEPAEAQPRFANQLYLNDGSGTFQLGNDSAADGDHYGMGAFAADVDGDNDLDLLVTNTGPLVLLRNNGDATFVDHTQAADIPQTSGLWINAAFADFNNDGALDVYVARYTSWSVDTEQVCHSPGGLRDYCSPKRIPAATDLLLFGHGDGTFTDATKASGIDGKAARSMGAVALDVERDGDIDIYVACDAEENLLWINRGDGTFVEEAMVRGAALNSAGAAEAGMGIACADTDADGDEDLIISHLANETHTLYANDNGFFIDASSPRGLGGWSRPDTGFGIGLVDFDNDGHLDLLVANGGVARPTRPQDPTRPYDQVDRIARGAAHGRFPMAKAVPGSNVVSRGAAFGDLDNDGRVDVVIATKDGPPLVLRNETETTSGWIGIRPALRSGGPAVIGAIVTLVGEANREFRTVRPHASYLASSEDVVRFGLGNSAGPTRALVQWPDGVCEQFDPLDVCRVHTLVKDRGKKLDGPLFDEAEPPGRQESDVIEPATRDPGKTASSNSALGAGNPPPPASEKLGPLPKLTFKKRGLRDREAILDGGALDAWCLKAGLPPPPRVDALDAPTWSLVLPCIEAAGRDPTAKTLGDLAQYYDGHRLPVSAIALYETLTALAPDDARWWHLLGRLHSTQGQHEEAAAAFANAVRLLPNAPAPVARLARMQMELGRLEAASENWHKYRQLRPNDPIGLIGIAELAETAGELDKALSASEEAIALNPNARPALVIAARVASRLNQRSAATKFAQRASRLTEATDPILVDRFESSMYAHAKTVTYLQKAVVHYKSARKFAQAYEAAKLLVERRPDEPDNWKLLLWLATATRDQKSLSTYAQIAVELDESFAPGWETLAGQALISGEFTTAAQNAIRALKLQPNLTQAYLTLGLSLGKLNKHEDAIKALNQFLTANPQHLIALQMKAACLFESGSKGRAREVADLMLRVDPGNVWARDLLSRLE